jgi:hypothetical protein
MNVFCELPDCDCPVAITVRMVPATGFAVPAASRAS